MNYKIERPNLFRASSLRSMLDAINGEKDHITEKKENNKENETKEIEKLSFFHKDGLGPIVGLASGITFFVFETTYGIKALYFTPTYMINHKCPHSFIWYYLLNTLVFVKTLFYFNIKLLNELQDYTNIIYFLFLCMIYSGTSCYWGYNETHNLCIQNEFKKTKLLTYSILYTYLQGSMAILLAIPISSCVKQKMITTQV